MEPEIPHGWLAPSAPPLEIDFGCHRGAFLTGMASAFPEGNFLGIEKQTARVEFCNKRFLRLGLKNAHAIRGEGEQALKDFLPDACAATLHVSFPDPWPKRRHERRRVVTPGFLAEAARVLRPDGSLRLMTDDRAYFDQMRNLTATAWSELSWDDGIVRPPTTFEKTFLALGKIPFRCALRHA